MRLTNRKLLPVLAALTPSIVEDGSLAALARRVGLSPFHAHRAFRALIRETPKQYVSRVRLERAAARLAASDEPILAVALGSGFDSHEVFTRAFRRRFGCSPSSYRKVALAGTSPAERVRHLATVDAVLPCINLFHLSIDALNRRPAMPTSPIERRELAAEPILFVRRNVTRAELPETIGQCLGAVFGHAQKAGLALAGQPFTRYPEAGPGLLTVEIGFRVTTPGEGEGQIEAGFLADGAAAVAVHEGAYDQLGETYAALERWGAAEGVQPRGAPWEVYVTDPAEYPNPADWRTEVFWPFAED